MQKYILFSHCDTLAIYFLSPNYRGCKQRKAGKMPVCGLINTNRIKGLQSSVTVETLENL